ncbi:hypothetical protein MAR_023805 [Mya arenaria]|uniref:Uncharacterized protein n=1 Tax=Mya arenaria TaxID=6604 RepID=A0ABY7DP14_MYAAR|nr:hypothetical protein MAR_023805 [Mya arenaria]
MDGFLQVGKIVKDPTTAASGSKYVVDKQGSAGIQRPDQRFVPKTPASGERRRFGDPPPDSSRGNRRKTPRLRHPMEIQRDNEEDQTKAERLKKKEEFWQEEKVARSGRRREHPEAVTIPSVKEDPFDHKEQPKSAPIVAPSRTGKSALTQRMERENTTFFDPPKDPKSSDDVFEKASHLWNYKTQTFW